MLHRRHFLALCATVMAALVTGARPPRRAHCHGARSDPRPHPDPRPGITADKVLTREQLAGAAAAIPAFDEVREIPQIIDGIRCHCGCADDPSFYSLLSCYEGEAMARLCEICQGQGRLAYRLHQGGKSLDEIRVAIDARFG